MEEAASLQTSEAGLVEVQGPLTHQTVGALSARSAALFEGRDTVTVDLNGVTHANSAGLSLILEWLREAKRRDAEIHFVNVPQQMRSIARLSQLSDLFDTGSGEDAV